VEKAYAKFKGGTYARLNLGYAAIAFTDCTGGITEQYYLDASGVKPDIDHEPFWKRLNTAFSNSALMACSRTGDIKEYKDKGLMGGHIYGITGLHECKIKGKTQRLVRLRNPWGCSEWTGSWSDGSAEWKDVSDEEKKAIGLVNRDDGEFWFPFEDSMIFFNYLDICHMPPDESEEAWKMESSKIDMTPGQITKYMFDVTAATDSKGNATKDAHVIVSLGQSTHDRHPPYTNYSVNKRLEIALNSPKADELKSQEIKPDKNNVYKLPTIVTGSKISVNGVMKADASKWVCNLLKIDPQDNASPPDVELCVQGTYGRRLDMNNRVHGAWKTNEDKGWFPGKRSQRVDCDLIITDDVVKIFFNGSFFCDFKHRSAKENYCYLTASGDVLEKVSFSTAGTYAYPGDAVLPVKYNLKEIPKEGLRAYHELSRHYLLTSGARSLFACRTRREESPNSTEQCAG